MLSYASASIRPTTPLPLSQLDVWIEAEVTQPLYRKNRSRQVCRLLCYFCYLTNQSNHKAASACRPEVRPSLPRSSAPYLSNSMLFLSKYCISYYTLFQIAYLTARPLYYYVFFTHIKPLAGLKNPVRD